MTVIEFLVGGDAYAFPLEVVKEVLPAQAVGASPSSWNEHVPAIRITGALGLEDDPEDRFTRAIVLETGAGSTLVLVHGVLGVRTVDEGHLVDTPGFFPPGTREAVRALLLEGDRIAVVLDPVSLVRAPATPGGDG